MPTVEQARWDPSVPRAKTAAPENRALEVCAVPRVCLDSQGQGVYRVNRVNLEREERQGIGENPGHQARTEKGELRDHQASPGQAANVDQPGPEENKVSQ